jgi:hypothetical protein
LHHSIATICKYQKQQPKPIVATTKKPIVTTMAIFSIDRNTYGGIDAFWRLAAGGITEKCAQSIVVVVVVVEIYSWL